MDNISEIQQGQPEGIGRRSFMKGTAALVAVTSIAALTQNKPRQAIMSVIENVGNLGIIELKRVKHGITTIPEATRRLDKSLLELKPQEYDLSCEYASTTYLLKALGYEYTEDQLIEKTTPHEFPWNGVHPELKNKKLNNSDRFGKLPPNPYGIYPGPLREMLGNLPEINNSNLEPQYWNQRVIRNVDEYKNTIKSLLDYGYPAVGWFSNAKDVAEIKSIQIGGELVATDQHAALITAYGVDQKGTEMLEYLDPINPSQYYYMPIAEWSERAAPVGYNLLSLLPKDNAN